MKITDSNLKNSASDLAAQNHENHFSFEQMVKLVPVSQGNPVLKAELIDKTQFESTPYTDSINCVSNLIRKFEQPIWNIADPDVKSCDGDLDFNELPDGKGVDSMGGKGLAWCSQRANVAISFIFPELAAYT
ncbi:hypothetical protein LXL04_023407 [Taraxacum kok-saghyz]